MNLDEGPSGNQMPRVVLLNGNSASASEILAGALHDNHRASLIGDPTYGKGKIQSVFELGDGSALFVTVAKYVLLPCRWPQVCTAGSRSVLWESC